MNVIAYGILVVVSYLIGAIPTAYLIVKKLAGKDVTQFGSGNIGTMNTHRATENKRITLIVLLGDMAKGAAAILLAGIFFSADTIAPMLAGAAVVLGHNYSIYMKFRGGKGLATAAGAMLIYNPLILLIWLLVWSIPFLLSKILVVGTLVATILTPVVVYILRFDREHIIFAAVISVIVLLRHITKMRKVLEGSEPKKYWKIRDENSRPGS